MTLGDWFVWSLGGWSRRWVALNARPVLYTHAYVYCDGVLMHEEPFTVRL